jgi:glycine/D-amino acid oxidase-like deaminating enzyme
MVAEESDIARRIPAEYDGLYSLVPHKDILALLETEDPRYVAALSGRKGCMNSAAFTEELAGYLLDQYPGRLRICEDSPMDQVALGQGEARLKVNDREVRARRVVLCTNGFEKFDITNSAGEDIQANFRDTVRGAVGYMAGYLEDRDRSPVAISYLGDKDVYFYLTRRPFENERNERHNLVCVGGPETIIEDTSSYRRDTHLYPDEAIGEIDGFLHATREGIPAKIDYLYRWHGLMGYTPNRVRLIGEEPRNRALLYNLGCNGIGILPSVYGAKRISQIVAGESLEPSIFDPK